MRGVEAAQPRDQPARGKGAIGGNGQVRAVALDHGIAGGLGDGVEYGRQARGIAFARIAQHDTPAGAHEQFRAEPFFQLAHMARNGCMGDEQFVRRLGEALRAGRGFKGA
jgi:hypothetical protein